jgi:hypothetical protein
VRRVNKARRTAPNMALARAILGGQASDPRPIVADARARGVILAPRKSAAALAHRAAKRRKAGK